MGSQDNPEARLLRQSVQGMNKEEKLEYINRVLITQLIEMCKLQVALLEKLYAPTAPSGMTEALKATKKLIQHFEEKLEELSMLEPRQR